MSYVLGMDKIKEGESIEINCIYIFAYFKKYLYLQCNYNINEKKVIVLSIENEPYFFDT